MTQVLANPAELTALRDALCKREAALAADGHQCIRLCLGASCIASGALKLKAELERELAERQLQDKVAVVGTGCLGPCSGGPVLMIGDVFYEKLTPQDARDIVVEHFGPKKGTGPICRNGPEGASHKLDLSPFPAGRIVERLTHKRPDGRSVPNAADMDFFKRQNKILLRNCGRIDPQRIEDYIAQDGYQALARTIEANDPPQVIETMRTSGLRGRGGAGFPTWRKWKFTRDAAGDEKFVVCNADEGDPGAFMDRSILEGDPHSVIEGMAIAAHTVGAERGYIYVRAEYPLAVERLKIALAQARERGLLGKNILGSEFDFDMEIRMGSGAFVCGEETALLTSIEGNRGEPRPRPPFPAVQGLWGKPTRAEQRRNLRQRAGDRPQRRRPGTPRTAPNEQGHQGLRPGRNDQELRPGRGARRHAAGRPDLRHRRRHPQRQGVQGGADRRPLRRLHPQAAPERPAGLRVALRAGRDHGLRRPDRHGRGQLHGRRRPLLPRIRPGGIVRQVRPLPRGHQADAGNPQPHLRGPRRGGRRRAADRPGRDDQGHVAVRPGPDGAQPGALDDPPLRPRVHRAHPRQALPGGRLRGAGLRPLLQRLPGQRRHPRLRLAGRRETLRRGPAAAPRAEPLRGHLLAGLLPHLRGQVPPVDARRAGVDPRHQAVHGRPGGDDPTARGPRERSATRSRRSPSSGPVRRACPAPTSSPGWATGRRSSRRSRVPAACWCRPFPPTGCRAKSSPARSA